MSLYIIIDILFIWYLRVYASIYYYFNACGFARTNVNLSPLDFSRSREIWKMETFVSLSTIPLYKITRVFKCNVMPKIQSGQKNFQRCTTCDLTYIGVPFSKYTYLHNPTKNRLMSEPIEHCKNFLEGNCYMHIQNYFLII